MKDSMTQKESLIRMINDVIQSLNGPHEDYDSITGLVDYVRGEVKKWTDSLSLEQLTYEVGVLSADQASGHMSETIAHSVLCSLAESNFRERLGVDTTKTESSHIPLAATERGFVLGKFTDYYGESCSIQKSSIATEDCIWLGVDDVSPKIMASDANRLGLSTSAENGWVDYEIPKEVLLSSRMHLTQDMVRELLPLLHRFVETGELYE